MILVLHDCLVWECQQIATLARQMYQGRSHFLLEAFQDATKHPFGYLLIDLKPKPPDFLRICTSITSVPIVYIHVTKFLILPLATTMYKRLLANVY